MDDGPGSKIEAEKKRRKNEEEKAEKGAVQNNEKLFRKTELRSFVRGEPAKGDELDAGLLLEGDCRMIPIQMNMPKIWPLFSHPISAAKIQKKGCIEIGIRPGMKIIFFL